ncbi:YggT family protein [Solwaraspora sp. WMMB335]|uniref:YggT family protein n=1 Tax=Solwaraspora sp. WMMB335 TaxID=3404118 RepID=UPI003B94F665
MGAVFAVVDLLLLLVQLLLVVRAIMDWTSVLAGPASPGSARSRLTNGVHAVTEPVLAPVRRALPPLRFGGVGIDLAFIVVFLALVIVRALLP